MTLVPGNPFRACSLDQLHTLATALGNAVKHIDREQALIPDCPMTVEYMGICIQDNEELLGLINIAILEKKQEARQ